MQRGNLAALAGLVFVISWLACGPAPEGDTRTPGAADFEWIVDSHAYRIEMRAGPPASGAASGAPVWEYRFLDWPARGSDWLDASTFQQLVKTESERSVSRHWLLGLVNASSWRNFLWVLVGLVGQLCFFGRMFVQWLASEREGVSVVPPIFWWLSLAGGLALLAYFVWRRDPIGILGQSAGAFVYGRNLRLIHAGRRQAATSRRER